MENGPCEDVVPIENEDIPASYVSLPEGNFQTGYSSSYLFKGNTINGLHVMVVGFLFLLLPACSDFSCPKMATKKHDQKVGDGQKTPMGVS